jgi:acyl carrier protein
MPIEERLRAFVAEELGYDGGRDGPSDDEPLIERGVVDSMGILNLVSFIESEFGVEIQDEELVPQHFGTIASMAALIRSKDVAA